MKTQTMIQVRRSEEIYQAFGRIENGTFHGRWHFSFDQYYDPRFMNHGTLRVFNDDTLSPGAIWPLHPHREIEVVTYCAAGEFRHEDERGKGGILKKGWVQHTTVGRGMWHSEINNLPDQEMRFIQMWFRPSESGLVPSVEQRAVETIERTNRFLTLVSPHQQAGALPIHSDAMVFSSRLLAGHSAEHALAQGHGAYLYVVEGGAVMANGQELSALSAAMISGEPVHVKASQDAELLLVDVKL